MTNFKPIKTSRVFEDVLIQLKEAILLGVYKSGDKLPSERELTLEFQVSRGVIREAIRALELSGIEAMFAFYGLALVFTLCMGAVKHQPEYTK